MNYLYKIIPSFLFVFVIAISTIAQQNINITSGETELVFEDQYIKIEGTVTECDNLTSGINNSYVLLKITNLTQDTRSFKIQQDLYYDGTCLTCGKDEYLFSYTLSPGEIKTGKCSEKKQSMRLFHHMPANFSPTVLTQYNLHVSHQ
jgi:predicted nucleic-acid-binding Zn-ribbon protein